MSISYINRSREGENMAYNEGINDLKVNRWNGTDPEDGLPAQIEFWREHFTRTKFPDKLAEFNEYVRREGLEEMTTKTEYRTLDTTDKGAIQVGDRVTFSWENHPEMGQVTGMVYNFLGDGLLVADYPIRSKNAVIHKIERPVIALPTEPGLYTIARGDDLESYRVFAKVTSGFWLEKGAILDIDHEFFKRVADGTWTLRRLVVEGD